MLNNIKPLNVVIIGQGAIGLLYYHYLRKIELLSDERKPLSTVSTTLLATDQYEDKSRTYKFTDIKNQQTQGKVQFTQPKHLQNADIVLCCVKSYHVSAAIESVVDELNPKAVIILAHNGMGTLEQLAKKVIKQHVFAAMLTTHGSLKTDSYTIRHTGEGLTQLGLISTKTQDKRANAFSGQSALQRLDSFIELLNKVLPKVVWEEDIRTAQWHKLAINCVINPLSAMLNIKNGKIADTVHLAKVNALLLEIVAVAQKESVHLNAKKLLDKVIAVAKATAENSSSMRCDVLAKRKTEIDYINGYICNLAEKHRLKAPENKNLVEAIKSLN